MKTSIINLLTVLLLLGCSSTQYIDQDRSGATNTGFEDSAIPPKSKALSEPTEKGFIKVQGVYTLPTLNRLRKAGSEPIGSIWSFDHFSYIPNTGKSFDDAVVVRSWNCGTGALAEGVLLSVLFGAIAEPTRRECRTKSIGNKHYHIYEIEISDNKSREVYFDATQYHGVY